jgi:hypothetical protein
VQSPHHQRQKLDEALCFYEQMFGLERIPSYDFGFSGAVRMYLRDPAGHSVEVNWPDVTTPDRRAFPELKKLKTVCRRPARRSQRRSTWIVERAGPGRLTAKTPPVKSNQLS